MKCTFSYSSVVALTPSWLDTDSQFVKCLAASASARTLPLVLQRGRQHRMARIRCAVQPNERF